MTTSQSVLCVKLRKWTTNLLLLLERRRHGDHAQKPQKKQQKKLRPLLGQPLLHPHLASHVLLQEGKKKPNLPLLPPGLNVNDAAKNGPRNQLEDVEFAQDLADDRQLSVVRCDATPKLFQLKNF
jgi:hypothetical protein